MFDSAWRGRPSGSQFSLGAGTGDTGHLATEAVAAYVDGELRMSAHLRASGHIAECPLCAAEVDAQAHARAALQSSAVPRLPEDLLVDLRSIPQKAVPSLDDAQHGRPHRGGPAQRRRRFF
ncbi:RNA polymerase subunit sigma-70 [Tomitella fengzijianii]|uniref:RNA polymerase subunit sigma-70 n=1 Tax=Tomitella fengzijianii TaxID=2597660 RepID=UPI0018EEEC0D|nr:RNA polymerase subunit sigma-70 [Tomitella fengzijianii]